MTTRSGIGDAPLLDRPSFESQFKTCLRYCEDNPGKFELAYGKPSSFSSLISDLIKARKDLEEIRVQNRLLAAEKGKSRVNIDLVTERKLQKSVQRIEDKALPLLKEFIAQNYELYSNSNLTILPLVVLGDSELRNSEKELKNFGILSYGETAAPKRLIPIVPTLIRGSILNDGKWSILKNDAFILGIIHSHKTAYVASFGYESKEQLLEKVFWDKDEGRPALPGREVSMLCHAGYRQVATEEQAGKYGYTFVCLDHEKAGKVKLVELILAAEQIKSLEQIASMFEPNLEF